MQKDETWIWNHYSPTGICQFQRGGWKTECLLTVFKFKDTQIRPARSQEALVNTPSILDIDFKGLSLIIPNKDNSDE